MDRCCRDAESNTPRLDRDRADWKSLLFDRGGPANQWIIWDPTTSRYIQRGTDPTQGGVPAFVPRPATNVFSKKIDGCAAILNQSEPAQVWGPSTDDEADRAAAEVAEDAVPVLREECGYDKGDRERLNRLACLTNGAAYVVYYDTDERHGVEGIETFQCNACGAEHIQPQDMTNPETGEPGCPECGAPEEDLGLQLDGMGQPVMTYEAVGRICGDILPSFEWSVPKAARTLDTSRLPWFLAHSRMAPHEVAQRWPKAADMANDRSKWAFRSPVQRQYADALRSLASPQTSQYVGGGSATEFDGPVVYRLWHDPIDDGVFYFPEGFMGVRINDVLVEAGPLPLKDQDDKAFKNVIIRTYTPSMVSAFGKPVADDLVPLQEQRNTIEALLILTLQHDAAATTYIPESVTLIDEPTGVPGETVRYSSLDGQKPTRDRGINPPEAIFKALEIIDQKFEELSGLNSVLSGGRPDGDPTLGEVQILQERGMQTFREPLDALIRFEVELGRILLNIARTSVWSPRLRRLRGENGQWEITEFVGADLAGKVDVTVERASAWPKSPLMEELKIKQAVELGILMPAQDPELAAKLLVKSGLSDLKPSMDTSRKQVARLLDRWKAATSPMEVGTPDPDVDDLALHLVFTQDFLRTEEAELIKTQNPPVYQAMRAYVSACKQAQMMAQMQAAAAQAGTPAPGADPMAAAVDSGLLQPAGAVPPPADPMDPAVQAGLLQPAGAVPPPGPTGPSIDDLMTARLLQPLSRDPEAAPAAAMPPPPMPGVPPAGGPPIPPSPGGGAF